MKIELIIVYKLQLNFELYNVLKLQKYTIIVNSTMLVVKVSIWRALKILEFFFREWAIKVAHCKKKNGKIYSGL